ncbi:hypothetical protein CEUSTIGMA_g13932.t1 [Chlamydomonas eustigma]|uniref:Uncharacterized protein n=1 Tax=Chlamydomonas eustigma TaxID=1157962 RepID=A0A250XTY4_9CHLO|nr:hypothetical protein CEUSTIGMA_g13932.t1 [Chlamydomonas eustigma]|eukprot:GAX86525.1 hypothetical protein CEUSTIGMA_g13932.t1 [Chlamydomonas eustigma]
MSVNTHCISVTKMSDKNSKRAFHIQQHEVKVHQSEIQTRAAKARTIYIRFCQENQCPQDLTILEDPVLSKARLFILSGMKGPCRYKLGLFKVMLMGNPHQAGDSGARNSIHRLAAELAVLADEGRKEVVGGAEATVLQAQAAEGRE